MKRICQNCVHWEQIGGRKNNRDDGVCMRYPPVLDPVYLAEEGEDSTDTSTCWSQPITEYFYTCGEFKRKKK